MFNESSRGVGVMKEDMFKVEHTLNTNDSAEAARLSATAFMDGCPESVRVHMPGGTVRGDMGDFVSSMSSISLELKGDTPRSYFSRRATGEMLANPIMVSNFIEWLCRDLQKVACDAIVFAGCLLESRVKPEVE